MKAVLLDTGPLVALVLRSDSRHAWAVEQLHHLAPPLVTCDAVLAEACFLLKREKHDPADVLRLASAGLFKVEFDFNREAPALLKLLTSYRDQPMSLADACLVRMAEMRSEAAIWTLDRDFRVYRKNGRQTIPLITPY